MAPADKIVLSASRRTDIPAFYMDWFMSRMAAGFFEVINPYNNTTRHVPAGVDRVHTIAFWSKNFERFISGQYGEKLIRGGYHLFFNFTVNSQDARLEPNLPPLSRRLGQLAELAERFGPQRIHWRFDPICFYSVSGGKTRHNLTDLEKIADAVAAAGVRSCITSFMDLYKKIDRRVAHIPGFLFIDPGLEKKVDVIQWLESTLKQREIDLYTCCEKEVITALPKGSTVSPSACVPGHLFVTLDGGTVPLKKDPGQRRTAGCGCTLSMDIGGYREQPCFHNCLFCYANPSSEKPPRQGRATGRGA